jgi:hypothetical protein
MCLVWEPTLAKRVWALVSRPVRQCKTRALICRTCRLKPSDSSVSRYRSRMLDYSKNQAFFFLS